MPDEADAEAGKVKIVAAGQSPTGMAFAAKYADYNFLLASGCNTPTAHPRSISGCSSAVEKTGRDVGAYVLFMVIADETDEAAHAKWKKYKDGVDVDALAWMADQGSQDKTADARSTAATINLPEQARQFQHGHAGRLLRQCRAACSTRPRPFRAPRASC